MDLLKSTISELNNVITDKSKTPEQTARIYALTELLKVLTYNYRDGEKTIFNFETIEKHTKATA